MYRVTYIFCRILVSFIYIFIKSFNFPYENQKMSKNYKNYYMINNFSFSYQKIYKSCSCKVSKNTPIVDLLN